MKDVKIHPTAVVQTEDIGKGTVIGPFAFISERVKIGENCRIYGASIGLPGEHPHSSEDVGGIVEVGDNVEIREYVTINAPIFGDLTLVSDNCYLMAKSHVGHDAQLASGVVLHTGSIVGGHSVIGKHCYLGLNSSIHQKSILGSYCIVGANSFFKGRSPSAITWAGVPARPLKINTVGLERHASELELSFLVNQARVFLSKFGR